MKRQLLARLAAPVLLALAALAGPALFGPSGVPSFAAASVQMLPPGSTVRQLTLSDGGFVRAGEIEVTGDGIVVTTRGVSRLVPRIRPGGSVQVVRMWLGTDHQGRSVLARLVGGARTSLVVAAISTSIALLLGTLLGLASALAPPAGRALIETATDALLGLPRLLLLLMLGVLLRGSPAGMGLAIGLASWMEISRLVQAEALRLRAEPFLTAAEAAGAGRVRLALRHLLPNLSPILAVAAPLVATQAILLEATLSFLGVAGSGEWASWGRIVADGQRLLPGGWWIVLFPGLLLCATALAVHGLTRVDDSGTRHWSTS